MNALLMSLTRAVEGSPTLAFGAALIWGVMSVLLSPCHLASIPLIVAFIGAQGGITTRRAFGISLLFSLGILITIAAIGLLTAAAGRMLGDIGAWGNYLVAGLFFLIGLHLLDVIPMPWSGPGQISPTRKGLLGAFFMGLIYGVALGPCTFAYMAPMLGVTFRISSTNWLYGAGLLATYGVGHCAVIVLAGTSTELVERYLKSTGRGTAILRKACGVLILLGGVWLVYSAP